MSLSPLYLDLTTDLHVRTAFELPPSFHLASSGPGKARYLSGPSAETLLQILFIEDPDRILLITTDTLRYSISRFTGPRFHYALTGFNHHQTRFNGRLLSSCFKTIVNRPCCAPWCTCQRRGTRSQARQNNSIYLPEIEAGNRSSLRSCPGHHSRLVLCMYSLPTFLRRPSVATSTRHEVPS
jgi:hypothetical protein